MTMAYSKGEYYAVKDKADALKQSVETQQGEIIQLQEEVEILRAERSHWYHMYNNNVDERPDI